MRSAAVWGLASLAVLPAWAQQPLPTFEASVESVYVDVFVARGGAPVTGLAASDFEVLDNGVVQNARLADVSRTPLTATLAFDVSGSLAGERLAQLRAAGHAFVDHLGPTDDVGLLAFSHELSLIIPHTRDSAALHKGLDGFGPGGQTALYDALYAALRLPAGPGRTLVVAFTDGEDNASWLDAEQVLAVAEESNTLVHVVSLGRAPDPAPGAPPPAETAYAHALRRISEATGGRVWNAAAPADLPRAFVGILDELRTRYLLAYEPTGVTRAGRHRLEVRVRGGQGQVRARPGYFVAPPR